MQGGVAPSSPNACDDLGPQLVDVEPAGVEHEVGVAAQLAQQRALAGDAVDEPVVALQRVRPADRLEAAHQRVVGRLEEQHPRAHAALGELVEAGAQVGGEPAAADVDDDGDAVDGALRAAAEVDHRRRAATAAGCRRRTSRGPPGTWPRSSGRPGQPGDDDEVEGRGDARHDLSGGGVEGGHGLVGDGARARRRWPRPCGGRARDGHDVLDGRLAEPLERPEVLAAPPCGGCRRDRGPRPGRSRACSCCACSGGR